MITIENWGLISYSEAWERQTVLFDELIDAKLNGKPYTNRIIFCQHPHVYTLGKHGKAANMLLNPTQLQTIHAELFQVDRGGDITYHGPGQWVCYPGSEPGRFSLGFEGIPAPVRGSGDPRVPYLRHRSRQSARGYWRLAGHGYARRT